MEVIESIEHTMKEGVLQVWMRIMDMGQMDTAKLLSAVLQANGHKAMTYREVSGIIHGKLGVNSTAFSTLHIHLNYFLRIALEPPELREEMAKRVGEAIGKLTAPPASPGETTSNSA